MLAPAGQIAGLEVAVGDERSHGDGDIVHVGDLGHAVTGAAEVEVQGVGGGGDHVAQLSPLAVVGDGVPAAGYQGAALAAVEDLQVDTHSLHLQPELHHIGLADDHVHALLQQGTVGAAAVQVAAVAAGLGGVGIDLGMLIELPAGVVTGLEGAVDDQVAFGGGGVGAHLLHHEVVVVDVAVKGFVLTGSSLLLQYDGDLGVGAGVEGELLLAPSVGVKIPVIVAHQLGAVGAGTRQHVHAGAGAAVAALIVGFHIQGVVGVGLHVHGLDSHVAVAIGGGGLQRVVAVQLLHHTALDIPAGAVTGLEVAVGDKAVVRGLRRLDGLAVHLHQGDVVEVILARVGAVVGEGDGGGGDVTAVKGDGDLHPGVAGAGAGSSKAHAGAGGAAHRLDLQGTAGHVRGAVGDGVGTQRYPEAGGGGGGGVAIHLKFQHVIAVGIDGGDGLIEHLVAAATVGGVVGIGLHHLALAGAGGVVHHGGGDGGGVDQRPLIGVGGKVAVLDAVDHHGLGGLVGLYRLVAALVAAGLGQHDVVKVVLACIAAVVGDHNAGGGVTVHIEGDGNGDPLAGHIGAVQTHAGAGRTADLLCLQTGYVCQVVGHDAVVADGGPERGLGRGGVAIHLKG